MELADDITEAFTEAAEEGGSWLTLGDRERFRCLVLDGITGDATSESGTVERVTSARLSVSVGDFATEPQPGERGQLEHGGTGYPLAVEKEGLSLVTGGGALYEFTMRN